MTSRRRRPPQPLNWPNGARVAERVNSELGLVVCQFEIIHQVAAASTIGRGRRGRTVIAINAAVMPIADDPT
jgi:hypothetical protein